MTNRANQFLSKKQLDITEAQKLITFIQSQLSDMEQSIKTYLESEQIESSQLHQLKHQIWLTSQNIDELSHLVNK